MMSTTLRNSAHRKTASEWQPQALRARELRDANARGSRNRGWEKVVLNTREKDPGVCSGLLGVLGLGAVGGVGGSSTPNRDPKLQEAALLALGALAHNNPPLAAFLGKQSTDRDYPPVLPHLVAFTKSRSVDVQLAACLCVTHILRALPTSYTTGIASVPPPALSAGGVTGGSHAHGHTHAYSFAGGAAPSASPVTSPFHPSHSYSHSHSHSPTHTYSRSTGNPYPFFDPVAGSSMIGSTSAAGGSEAFAYPHGYTYSGSGASGSGTSTSGASGSGGMSMGSGVTIGGGVSLGTGGAAADSGRGFSLVHTAHGGMGPSQAAVEEMCLRTIMNVVNRLLVLSPASGASINASGIEPGEESAAGAGSGVSRGAAAAVAVLIGSATTTGMAAGRNAAREASGGALGDAEKREEERMRAARYQAAVVGAAARTRACYILNYLVSDEPTLCYLAFERGCLEHLGALIHAINPTEPAPPDWEEAESEIVRDMREAALTALASLALYGDDIRRLITDTLHLLPTISRALRAGTRASSSEQLRIKYIGTRHAACQVVRAVSRGVSVLRTSIVDSGLGMDVLRIVLGTDLGDHWSGSISLASARPGLGTQTGSISSPPPTVVLRGAVGKEREKDIDGPRDGKDAEKGDRKRLIRLGDDRRVVLAALSAVCNIVNDFSPLRPIYLEEKLMPRLVQIIQDSRDDPLRFNALWAVKNLVRKTSTETKRDIMSHMGWDNLTSFMTHNNLDFQEQAFNVLQNLTDHEEGISMAFRELTAPTLLEKITYGLNSPSEDVVLQAACALSNLVNGSQEQQDAILQYPGILSALKMCLEEAPHTIRRPAVNCLLGLVKGNPHRRQEMNEVGIVGTLKKISEWSGHGPSVSHGLSSWHPGNMRSGGSHGVSTSPTATTGGSYWSGRSPPTRASAMYQHGRGAAAGSSGGVGTSGNGSWSGSGSTLHAYAATHGIGAGRPPGMRPWSTPHLGFIEDDRDVIARARQALEWLERGETYAI